MSITDRIDAITKIPPEYRAEVIPAPKSVKIEITSTCNYHCSYCVKSQQKDSGDMDRALYSRMVRECAEAGVKEWGVFYIGESFTAKWLPDAIREAKQFFPYVFLTTNGSAATPSRVRECMDAGLDSLKFSLNFSDEDQLASIAKVSPHYWRKSIENLKAARRVRDGFGFQCKLYASSIKYAGTQGKAMQDLVNEIAPFVDQHYWLPLYGMSGASKAAGWKPQPGNPGRLDAMRDPLPCWAVFTEGHITRNGTLAACCFGNGSDGSLAMADLTRCSFMEGWNNEAFQKLRRAHLAKDVSKTGCAECTAA